MTQIDGYDHQVARLGAENGLPFTVVSRAQAVREGPTLGYVGGGHNPAWPNV